MDNNKLHQEILDFYSGAVEDNYAERCIEFYEQKKKNFAWLFGDNDRIKLSVSDTEAVDFFFTHNPEFRYLYDTTSEFLRKMNLPVSVPELQTAIFKNRISYEKNQYKFSKFYNKVVKTENNKDINFQDFYDKLKTAECIISIHPLDFIGASANSSFSSCLAIDSCHHTATTAYLRDDITIMAYTTIGGRKLGRQWIYMSEYYIVMGNIYGCITHPIQEKIRTLIESKYAEHLNVQNIWKISKGKIIEEDCVNNCGHNSNDHSDYAVYFDLSVNALIRHKIRTSDFHDLLLDFSDGLDKNGDDTSSGHLEVNYCDCCNESIDGDGNYTEDGYVCDHCLNEHYTYCSDCERYFYENVSIYYIENEHQYVCESCYENGNYGFCEETEVYYSSDQLVEAVRSDGSTIYITREYAEGQYYFCDACESFHEEPMTQTDDDDYVCSECLEEDYELIDDSYVLKSGQAA
jgi:hypothetical protein